MSKQTNDKDERKAPVGQDQGAQGRMAAPRKAKSNKGRTEGGSSPAPQNSQSTPAVDKAGSVAGAEPQSDKPAVTRPLANEPAADSVKPASAPGKSSSAAQTASPEPGKAASGETATDKKTADKTTTGKADAEKVSTPAAAGGSQKPVPPANDGNGGGKGGRGISLLALILVLLLGLGVALFAWNVWERLGTQQQRLAELETQAATATEEVAGLQAQLVEGEQNRDAELSAGLESMQSEFSRYRSDVDEALDQVLAELSREQETDPREWLHAEAAYLLRLANQRLQLERDVEGAAALLRTADARLNEAGNPALLSIRRAIASELAILDGVPQVDRTGLYLALDAQQQRLAQLPLSRELEEIPARSGIEEAPTGRWQEQLSRFGQELKDLVVIRHHDEALEGLIAPEQESYLRQSARLLLEQAQLALLKEEQGLYEASLDKTLGLIDNYYDTESSEVQAVIERLQELKGANIQPELPDISGSQQALAEFIERRFGARDEGDDA